MDIQRKIDIMGIVNMTDDSYFADSRCLSSSTLVKTSENAVARAWKLIREGATIIDIGACSTRPGSEPVGEQVEWKRIAHTLSALLLACPGVRISIDTWWASVIEKAFAATAALIGEDKARDTLIVNDISAGEDDPSMLPLVGEIGLEYIAMHKRGNSQTMQSLCDYGNVTEEVLRYFEAFGQNASRYGIRKWVLDPGFGFAKTVDQNYQLLRGMDILTGRFSSEGIRTLVGVSRKSMIYRLFNITPEESLAQTQVLHMKALQCGADILRVHDAAEAARTVEMYHRLG